MLVKRIVFISLSVALLISTLALAQQSAAVHVTIVVTDTSGASVAHAQIGLTSAPIPDAQRKTDNKGELALDLEPGGYELFVSSPGFKQFVTKIDVSAAKQQQTVPVTLEVARIPGMMVSAADTLQLWAGSSQLIALTPADVKALPRITVTVHNSHANAGETYSGVRLADLFTKTKLGAPLGNELRGKALSGFIVAAGSDGYQAVLALAEIDPSFHPGEVLVADTMNDHPLDAHSGPFKLVVTEDKRPARSVRNLVSLELKMADER
ncbi:MAG: carboxypeptidase regulatory-like domain-containing protein [Candidatus Sulfotelmatobacter sp.]